MQHVHSGKVRDLYTDAGDLLLVASDRVSVYDVVLPTPIPGKGALLTQLSVWWFDWLGDTVANHLVSTTDVPARFGRNAVRCRQLDMIDVECVVRGYLAGSAVREYARHGTVCDVALPPRLRAGDRLPEPIFTPTTKASDGHDQPITYDEVVAMVGADVARRLRDTSVEIYRKAAEHAATNGVLIADTKFEFGFDAAGELTLADEVLTSDSSRFWPADEWVPGQQQPSLDKQVVRDWAVGTGWDKTPPGPEIPADVVAATRDGYVRAYEMITGMRWRDD